MSVAHRYLGVGAAASRLGCSRETIYRLIRDGILEPDGRDSMGRYRIPPDALEKPGVKDRRGPGRPKRGVRDRPAGAGLVF